MRIDMNSRQLLELAAKAGGIIFNPTAKSPSGLVCAYEHDQGAQYIWNSLTSDSDTLRLAVKLGLLIDCDNVLNEVEIVLSMRGRDGDYVRISEQYGDDPNAATRLAVTRAAAESYLLMEAK